MKNAGLGGLLLLAVSCRAPAERESEANTAAAGAEVAPDHAATTPTPPPPTVRAFTPTPVRLEPVTISRRPPSVGTISKTTFDLVIESSLDAMDGKSHAPPRSTERHGFDAELEILELGEDGPAKARLRYLRRVDEDPGAEDLVRKPAHPRIDRAYLLTRTGAEVTATYDDGTKPPPLESRAVADANIAFARGRFSALLPEGTLQPDQSFTLEESVVAPLFELRARRGQSVPKAELVYRGLATHEGLTLAVFSIDVQLQKLEGVLVRDIDLKGELAFDAATGRLVWAHGQGPLRIRSETGAHGGPAISGIGAITIDAAESFGSG